jgi:hypothetical protein
MRGKSSVDMLQRSLGNCSEPVAGFIDWSNVLGDSDADAPHGSDTGIGAILSEVAAEIVLEIDSNRFDTRHGRAAAQVQMTQPELEHVAEQLRKIKSSDPDSLAAAKKLRKVPTTGTDHRVDDAPLDAHTFFFENAGTLLAALPELPPLAARTPCRGPVVFTPEFIRAPPTIPGALWARPALVSLSFWVNPER